MVNKTWMKELVKAGKDKHIYDLYIPGTHNSAIMHSTINARNVLVAKDFQKFKAATYIIPDFFKFWTACQNKTILEQLEMGVRYLDFRISYTNNDFYITHTFQGPLLTDVLDQIATFYENNGTTEVIIVRCTSDHENKTTLKGKLMDLEKRLKEHRVSKYFSETQPAFKKISEYGDKPLLLLLQDELSVINLGYKDWYPAKWYNTNDENVLTERVKKTLKNLPSTTISVIQNILTPQVEDIIKSLVMYIYFLVLLIVILIEGLMLGLMHSSYAKWVILSGLLVFIIIFTAVIIYLRPSFNIHWMSSSTKTAFLEIEEQYNIVIVDYITEDFCDSIIKKNNPERNPVTKK